MTDWTAGYVADVGYTYGYYTELNPLRIRLALLNAGIVSPKTAVACELGYGQGMSANLHAVASQIEWYGTDFNPAQAAFAQELASISENGAKLYDQSFEEFCSRTDLPDFDYIGLHGIWSWISDQNRQVIVDFVRRKLKVGGVLYISYNTLPGWSAMLPMRDLLTEHADVMGSDGTGTVNRINDALGFAERLVEVNAAYFKTNPLMVEKLKQLKTQNRNYLAHEYFNRDWEPMLFSRMADWLGDAKLQWACSAYFLDAIDAVNLTPDQQQLLQSIPDTVLRQSTRDFCINQQFRRDYWIKGARKLTGVEMSEEIRKIRVILTQPRAQVSLKITGSLGEGNLQEAVYTPILDILQDYVPRTIAEIEQSLSTQTQQGALTLGQIFQAVLVLCSNAVLLPAQEEAEIETTKLKCRQLNDYLMNKSRTTNELQYLASPVIGGGINVPRFGQLFLLALSKGLTAPEQWAVYIWEQILSKQNESLIKDGKTLTAADENISELTRMATLFSQTQLPILRALQIVD